MVFKKIYTEHMTQNSSTSLRIKKKRWTRKQLLAFGIPAVLIPGMLTALVLGWKPTKLISPKNYYANQTLFPKSGEVAEVYDGDILQKLRFASDFLSINPSNQIFRLRKLQI